MREVPLKMASEYLKEGISRLNDGLHHDALSYFIKAHEESKKAQHQAPSFDKLLNAVRIQLISATFREAAILMDGNIEFIPLHCLPERRAKTIEGILRSGLETITESASKKSLFGKLVITPKRQDELGRSL